MSYLAHTGEGFISPAFPPSTVGETGKRYWVGTAPRLSIRDGDGGYARLTEGSTFAERVWVVAYLAPFTLTLPFFVDVQIRFSGAWSGSAGTGAAGVILGISNETNGTYVAADADEARFGLSIGPWHDVTFQMFPRDEAELAAAAAAGEVFIALTTILNADEAYDLSFLGLRGDSARPLRWRQRNDGLGGSSPKAARGVTSQQGSNRHRGYL